MLTDRDERALLASAENRIAAPLRVGVALAAVRRALTRLRPAGGEARESVSCHPSNPPAPARPTPRATPRPTPLPSPRSAVPPAPRPSPTPHPAPPTPGRAAPARR
ncbi:hypothetical protein GCM10010371_14290 [Streptomyces subrutilus]|uniref:Uncharacterized protein n=1 Tax=Streptomyces subrutilus TaxID=36818 RepID=A0A918QMA2_9ACTN|nr:hypothetical protein GCM10010371_14290 [Streptomyces subrutilus]